MPNRNVSSEAAWWARFALPTLLENRLTAYSMRFFRHFWFERRMDIAVKHLKVGWAKHVLSLTKGVACPRCSLTKFAVRFRITAPIFRQFATRHKARKA